MVIFDLLTLKYWVFNLNLMFRNFIMLFALCFAHLRFNLVENIDYLTQKMMKYLHGF